MKHLNLQLRRYHFIGKNDCTKEKNKDKHVENVFLTKLQFYNFVEKPKWFGFD